MCCDIHPKYPYLVVIGECSIKTNTHNAYKSLINYLWWINSLSFSGMFDGNVAVYNLETDINSPVYISRGTSGKHSHIVWEVKWGADLQDGELNFYSIAADGLVYNWVLMQSQLSLTTVNTLYVNQEISAGPDGSNIKLKGAPTTYPNWHIFNAYIHPSSLASGTCLAFHPKLPHIFLVGSEEGQIYKCSTEFSSRYLMTYNAHYLPVYRIDFNKFNSNIFASCAADWRVKIWEDMRWYDRYKYFHVHWPICTI